MRFAAAYSQNNSKLKENRLGETYTQTNSHLEPHDYKINYVNID